MLRVYECISEPCGDAPFDMTRHWALVVAHSRSQAKWLFIKDGTCGGHELTERVEMHLFPYDAPLTERGVVRDGEPVMVEYHRRCSEELELLWGRYLARQPWGYSDPRHTRR